LREALQIAAEIQYTSLVLTIVTSIGELLLQTSRPELAAEVGMIVLRHPACDRDTRDQATRLLARCESALPPAAVAAAAQRAQAHDLEMLVTDLQLELAFVQDQETRDKRQEARDQSYAVSSLRSPGLLVSQPLVEPLTERECDVLQLIAAGLSNQEISERLILSVGTVKWYAGQIYSKLAVQTRTQAIARAHSLRLLV
jgi:LuxR family maltose regulon positive regulatory protein